MLLHLVTLLVVAWTSASNAASSATDCSHGEYERCVRIADPLVREARLVFPDTAEDIDAVCETWRRFVDCLNFYTENCFSEQQRRQFNRAVEVPIESVHDLCTKPGFQREYLQYAPCIKSTITERRHCGPQYDLLVEQVSQGDVISKSTLCCSHDRFKQCVHAETRRLCDRGEYEGPASRFANQIIDKALSFLQDQCFNYIPNSGDCSTASTDGLPFSDPLTISTSSSEVYPWSTIQEEVAKEILPSRVTPPRPTTTAWLPSSTAAETYSPVHTTQEVLGSRSRPSSHGRAMWPEASQAPGNAVRTEPVNADPNRFGHDVQTHQESPPASSSTTPPSRPQLHTVNAWNVMGQRPGLTGPDTRVNEVYSRGPETTTHWYPAAGSQTANEADEPNQQGLVKPKHNGAQSDTKTSEIISITVIAIMASFC